MSGSGPTGREGPQQAGPTLDRLPEDWDRALAVVAHPDDLEYGASAAVARWTAAGKDVRYVLATRGEAGIDSMPPDRTGPLRTAEQVAGVASLVCHSTYIDNLGEGAFDPDSFLRDSCQQVGGTIGVQFGVAFELIPV